MMMIECDDSRCNNHQILDGRRKLDDEDVPPPELPPRPSTCPRHPDRSHQASIEAHLTKKRLKKYVFLCTVCGGLASLLGGLFLGVYLILRSYTSSLDYFETIPTYIPATMLLLTGLGIMCLARRKNRYAVLIKLCGVCCLVCAATCVLVTVTTTVIHMSRLQSLRECVYTMKTQTCTCYSNLLDSAPEHRTEDGAHYVFNSTPDCEVIHGALYSCLRAMFGLSVIGILVCIFCCMLVYQLLSHERKKMYWEQLELRCRYLYGQPRNQTVITPPQRCSHCACSQQFRFPVEGTFENRLWSGGRIGNLYSPNPVGDEAPQSSGWGWRLPWSRSDSHVQASDNRDIGAYSQPLGPSPDSQYGFTGHGVATVSSATSASYTMIEPVAGQVYQWGPPPPYSDPNSPRRICPVTTTTSIAVQQCPSRAPSSMGGGGGVVHVQSQPTQHETYLNLPHELDRCANGAEEVRVVPRSVMCGARRLPDSSSSSGKSEERINNAVMDENVSPRLKYIRQPNSANPTPRKRHELSESEVYFADVSSCCNGSIRNDSLLYDEPLNNDQSNKMNPLPIANFRKDVPNKQPRFVPDKSLHNQIQEGGKEFQKIPEERCSPEAYSEMAHDGSEEDDPELVSFSQRVDSRNRITDLTRAQCRNRMDLSQMNQDFPSPMSISSPSSGSKDFFPDTVNSDNGSAESVWSGCSPDFLAPDAQYETIPEPRGMSSTSKPQTAKRRVINSEWHGYLEATPVDADFTSNANCSRRTDLKNNDRLRNNVGPARDSRCRSEENSNSFEQALSRFENNVPEFRACFDKDVTNSNSPKFQNVGSSKVRNFDRCGNLAAAAAAAYYDEDGRRTPSGDDSTSTYQVYNSEGLHSPRHHYEEIPDNRSPCPQAPRYSSQNFCVSGRNKDPNSAASSVNSPKLFEKRLFQGGSPECIALVEESQCSHTDSSCRCSLSLNNRVTDNSNQ